MHMVNRVRAGSVVLLSLVLIAAATVPAQASERAADVLRLALPATAWGMTQWQADQEGEMQFYQSFASTVVTTYGLKSLIHKQRPDHSDNDAFPSGHTSMAFQGAAFLHRRYGWQYGIPAYALAGYVGWSRVDQHQHDSRDVLVGALIGWGSSFYFATPYHGLQVQPWISAQGTGLQISGKW